MVEDMVDVAALMQEMFDVAASEEGMVGVTSLMQCMIDCWELCMNRPFKNSMTCFSLFSSAFLSLHNSFILS